MFAPLSKTGAEPTWSSAPEDLAALEAEFRPPTRKTRLAML